MDTKSTHSITGCNKGNTKFGSEVEIAMFSNRWTYQVVASNTRNLLMFNDVHWFSMICIDLQ
jgi:hypothetical protein